MSGAELKVKFLKFELKYNKDLKEDMEELGMKKAFNVDEVDFYINRPFAFMIKEKSTGVILFMGKVTRFNQ